MHIKNTSDYFNGVQKIKYKKVICVVFLIWNFLKGVDL